MNAQNELPFVLGGAQLGMKYGIASNRQESPKEFEAFELLDYAYSLGFRTVDTAKAYGQSEDFLHKYLSANSKKDWKVITKIHSQKDDINSSIEAALLKFEGHLTSLLFHDAQSLSSVEIPRLLHLHPKLLLGVSIYTAEEFEAALRTPWVAVIQAPFNVWDWGLKRSHLLDKALGSGKEIYLRSSFLQGLLTMSAKDVERKLPKALPFHLEWLKLCSELQKLPTQAALEFVLAASVGCKIVLGIESKDQILQNVHIYQNRDQTVWEEVQKRGLFTRVPDIVTKPNLWDNP